MKRLVLAVLILALCLACSVTAGAASDPQVTDNANSFRYENGHLKEGIDPTARMRVTISHPYATLTGIDVSHHQTDIDWEKVKADGIDFAILRCGYGNNFTNYDDREFLYNAAECERLGIPYGVYIYSYANKDSDALSEAQHVLRLLEGRTLSYPVYYDLEDDKELAKLGTLEQQREKLADFAEIFCGEIEKAGYPVGVYANLNWWNTYLTDECFDQWPRWVAQYNTECRYEGEYAMWQYTSSGTVDGIEGRVDMNFQIGHTAYRGHEPDMEIISATEPTCTAEGNRLHYKCKQCGILYSDMAGVNKVTQTFVTLEKTPHEYVEWQTNDFEHWKECDCGKKGTVEPHEFVWITDREATAEENGIRHEECVECGFKQNENTEFEYDALFEGGCIIALAGVNRFDTAILSADALMQEKNIQEFKNIIVASGSDYPDALAGSYLAKVKDAPIILTIPTMDELIAEYVKYNLAEDGTVYILGGTGAVSENFEKLLTEAQIDSVRLAGQDRYTTNIEILKEAGVSDEPVLICSGTGFADSLSASAVGLPILLVSDEINDKQQAYLDSLDTEKMYLIGGTGVVSEKLKGELAKNYKTERLAGKNRYITSAVVAEKFFPEADTAMLAYAQNFPDGLSGGPLAMARKAPLLLVDNVNFADATAYAQKAGVGKIIIMGGPTLVSEETAALILGIGEE